jgi:translation initiation factor 1 (eIF-1/SUI1)
LNFFGKGKAISVDSSSGKFKLRLQVRYMTSWREMLQVAKISSMNVDTTAIKAVAKELRTTGATDKSIAAEQGVLRIQGRGRI